MIRRLAPALVLFVVLAPPPIAHAQVNIDQDKTPAHIYANDCAVCHKSIRGLANGRGSSALTGFLAEHYTSSSQEAAAVAAYVLAGGGGVGTAASVREEKPQPDHPRSAAEEPKTRDVRRTKPEQEPAASARPQRPAGERGKPDRIERSATAEPGRFSPERKLSGERREPNAATGMHNPPRPAEAAPAAPEPATVAAAPKPAEPPKPEVSPAQPAPSAAAPQQAQPGEASPAPTDNIPD